MIGGADSQAAMSNSKSTFKCKQISSRFILHPMKESDSTEIGRMSSAVKPRLSIARRSHLPRPCRCTGLTSGRSPARKPLPPGP